MVWQRAGLWHDVQQAVNSSNSAVDAIFHLLHHLSPDLCQRLAALLWSIWKHRNNKVWQEEDEVSTQVVDRAKTLIEDWIAANLPTSGTTQQARNRTNNTQLVPDNQTRWQKPALGRFKCNVDAAFSGTRNKTGIGICIRDEDGAFVLAKIMSFSPVTPVDVGEALGMYYAMEWLKDMQFDYIDFVVDYKTTSDAIHSDRADVTEFGTIIKGCKRMLSNDFTNSRVEFSRRQANVVVHALAREVTFLASYDIYSDVPSCIETLLINDML